MRVLSCTAERPEPTDEVTYSTPESTPSHNRGPGALARKCTDPAGALNVDVIDVGVLEAVGVL